MTATSPWVWDATGWSGSTSATPAPTGSPNCWRSAAASASAGRCWRRPADMAGLDIAFFGSSLVSAYWNGAATYYRGIVKALAARGHRVTFYEPDAYERQAHRDIADPPWARVMVYPAEEAAAEAMLERARDADIVVKASGVGVFDELLQEGVLAVRRPGGLAVHWDVDAPATLDRMRNDPKDPLRPLVPRYD